MAQKNRSNSTVLLALILAVFLCTAMTAAYSQGQEESGQAAPAPTAAAVSGQDSLAMARSDSMSFAKVEADMREHARLGWVYKLRYSGLGDFYIRGGIFMHPLLACSVIGAIFIIERLYTLSRARVDTKKLMESVLQALHNEGIDAALKVCEQTRGPIAAVVHSGLLRANLGPDSVKEAVETAGAIEVSFLERGLVVLATVSTIAPMLGFLGTVSGMMSAFAAIAAAEQVSAKIVASGIEEALITTITGLTIAIPVSVAHAYFVSQIDRFVLEMEEASANLVNELVELGRK
jgi:biopolymer transport protein ExbB